MSDKAVQCEDMVGGHLDLGMALEVALGRCQLYETKIESLEPWDDDPSRLQARATSAGCSFVAPDLGVVAPVDSHMLEPKHLQIVAPLDSGMLEPKYFALAGGASRCPACAGVKVDLVALAVGASPCPAGTEEKDISDALAGGAFRCPAHNEAVIPQRVQKALSRVSELRSLIQERSELFFRSRALEAQLQ